MNLDPCSGCPSLAPRLASCLPPSPSAGPRTGGLVPETDTVLSFVWTLTPFCQIAPWCEWPPSEAGCSPGQSSLVLCGEDLAIEKIRNKLLSVVQNLVVSEGFHYFPSAYEIHQRFAKDRLTTSKPMECFRHLKYEICRILRRLWL